MNNRLSYCGLVDAKIRASDKDLPVFQVSFKVMNTKTLIFKIFNPQDRY